MLYIKVLLIDTLKHLLIDHFRKVLILFSWEIYIYKNKIKIKTNELRM